MTATEDLFTPIHKGLRSMIYSVGGRLQTNDFADVAGSKDLLTNLQHDLGTVMAWGCALCVLHAHAGDEESGPFPALASIDSGLIQGLINEHHEFARRLDAIAQLARELPAKATPEERVAVGIALNQAANAFFALYIDHMNREETQVVPLMREHFTDDQMRAMRGKIMGAMPRERLTATLRWMLPSLNVHEMSEMLAVILKTAPPPMSQYVLGIASETVPPERLDAVKHRLGLAN